MYQSPTLEHALTDFCKSLAGKNRSSLTVRAYQTDIHQFITWLHENNIVVQTPSHIQRADITDYLSHLAERQLSRPDRVNHLTAIIYPPNL